MAMISILRRRCPRSLSSILFTTTPLTHSSPAQLTQSPYPNPNPSLSFPNLARSFRSTNISLARPRNSYGDDEMKIGPDDILFEGCDYNHWLITMDFPKDPSPSAEEMVETYVQTAAKVLGSEEEAKRKMYACSTTTYTGFQVEVSEDVSKKFEGLPGVVFILPDSYIDPVNKEYGGDKYENGIITHRPPPMQYGRQGQGQGGRFGDRNRDFNRPSRPRGEFQQGNPAFDNRTAQVSAGNFRPPQNPTPQQNYGPPRVAPINNSAGGQENYQGQMRDQVLPNQGNYQSQRGDSYPQGRRMPSGELNNNAPQQGVNFRQGAEGSYGQGAGGSYGPGAGGSYGPGAGGSYGPGVGGSYGPGAGGSYGQGAAGSYGPGAGGSYGQGGAGGSYGQGGAGGSYGQGAGGQGGGGSYGQGVGGSGQGVIGNSGQGGSGNYGQGAGTNYGQGAGGHYGQGNAGSYGQGTVGAVPGQEKFPNYGHNNPAHGGSQGFSQGEQMNDLQQVQR